MNLPSDNCAEKSQFTEMLQVRMPVRGLYQGLPPVGRPQLQTSFQAEQATGVSPVTIPEAFQS